MDSLSNALNVHTLGGFHLYWQGKEITLKSRSTTKAVQILQLTLYHAPKKLTGNQMIQELFAYDDILNPSNNLKASISLLRKQLRTCGLPGEDFITFKDGGYSWTCPLPIERDYEIFDDACSAALSCTDPAQAQALCEAAVNLYSGPFLPELYDVDWTAPVRVYYGNRLAEVARKLSQIYAAEKLHEKNVTLSTRMYGQLHTEEWVVLKMKSLMALHRWDEAKKVYTSTVTELARQYDLEPGEELLNAYRSLCSGSEHQFSPFSAIQHSIREDSTAEGAYFCAYPGFIDCCRVFGRNMNRLGVSCYLLHCSLSNVSGNAVQNPERLEAASKQLGEVLRSSLRKSDFFTQYSTSQYIALITGASLENCALVQERIEQAFQELSIRGIRIRFEFHSAHLNGEDTLDSQPASWNFR